MKKADRRPAKKQRVKKNKQTTKKRPSTQSVSDTLSGIKSSCQEVISSYGEMVEAEIPMTEVKQQLNTIEYKEFINIKSALNKQYVNLKTRFDEIEQLHEEKSVEIGENDVGQVINIMEQYTQLGLRANEGMSTLGTPYRNYLVKVNNRLKR